MAYKLSLKIYNMYKTSFTTTSVPLQADYLIQGGL